jgi:hypothetical protein
VEDFLERFPEIPSISWAHPVVTNRYVILESAHAQDPYDQKARANTSWNMPIAMLPVAISIFHILPKNGRDRGHRICGRDMF